MNLKNSFNKLRSSRKFLDWKAKNTEDYLVSIFFLFKSEKADEVVFDFYNSSEDKITSFSVADTSIKVSEDLDILKKEKKKIEKLEFKEEEIDRSFASMLRVLKDLMKDRFTDGKLPETFVTLQVINGETVWNVSVPLMQEFKLANLKFSYKNNQVLSNELINIFEFRKK